VKRTLVWKQIPVAGSQSGGIQGCAGVEDLHSLLIQEDVKYQHQCFVDK